MASSPITSWQREGGKVETETDFISLSFKISADGIYSHRIKRHLFLGRKAMTNLENILKSRDITLLTKVHVVKAMDFPVVMYGCENRELTFWSVVLEKTLESPWESKEIKPVNPKENQPWILFGRTDAEAEASTLCPPEEPTHWKRPWCWERLKPREGDNRGWDGWIASPTRWIWTWASSGRWWGTGKPGMLQSMGLQRVGHDLVIQQ